MSTMTTVIPQEVLAEQYYSVLHDILAQLQHRFREVDITQKDLAHRIGKQPAVVSRCLAGQENMTVRTMYEIARGMDSRLDVTLTPLASVTPSNRPIRKPTRDADDELPENTISLRPKTSPVSNPIKTLEFA